MRSVYRIGEFAEKIGRSVCTVRRWEAEGTILVRRSPSGQRYFADADVAAVLVVAHRDRLARFGFDDLRHEAATAGGEVVVGAPATMFSGEPAGYRHPQFPRSGRT